MKLSSFWFGLVFLAALTAQAAKVIDSNDGDTCRVEDKGKVIKVRLSGIDAPESEQPEGPAAREFLVGLVKGKDVELKCDGVSYDRQTCKMFLNGQDVQEAIVKAGHGFDAPKFSGGKYGESEKNARVNKLGMWKSGDVTSPFCWKRRNAKPCLKNRQYQP